MNNELVSAIITTHNRIDLLPRAIDSVLSQTYKNIECIVVDDASIDETQTYCDGRSDIIYVKISKEESRGGNYARNVGIKRSKGVYCAFLDDDDYWLPEKIEKQVELIEKKDCELVHCGRRLEVITNNGIVYEDILPLPIHYGDMHKKILLSICTNTSNILVKRNALFEIGLFDENLRFWQEYELTIRLAQRKPFYAVNEVLIVYRINKLDTNRLTNKYIEWKNTVRYIHSKHKELYSKLNFFEKMMVKSLCFYDAKVRLINSNKPYQAFMAGKLAFIFKLPYRLFLGK